MGVRFLDSIKLFVFVTFGMKIMSLISTQTLYFKQLVCRNIIIMTMQICNVGSALNFFTVFC